MSQYLKGVIKSLRAHDVRYVTVGGVAAILHGAARATFDLDILIEATHENAQQTLNALKDAGLGTAYLTTAEDMAANAGTIFKDFVRVDVLTRIPGITFEEAWDKKVIVEFQGEPMFLLCRDHVILAKKASGREIDLQDVKMLQSLNP